MNKNEKKDLVLVNDKEVNVKEYKGQRVVTFMDIDTVHERPDGTARKRFNDNKKHFIEYEDFYKVKCDEVRPFFGQTLPNGFNPDADITLLTESGYLMLVKSFKDDLAWKVQRKLVNTYFKAKDNIENLIMPKDYPSALRSLADEYEKRQLAKKKNKELKKEISYKEDVITGLTDEITLADKRQILNRVVRYKNANKSFGKWFPKRICADRLAAHKKISRRFGHRNFLLWEFARVYP